MAGRYLDSKPYPWPYNGDLRPENTALIVIDMQTDFCGKGGYVELMGYDISNSRACIKPIDSVLCVMRKGGYTIIHTREGHRPDLADLAHSLGLQVRPAGSASRFRLRRLSECVEADGMSLRHPKR